MKNYENVEEIGKIMLELHDLKETEKKLNKETAISEVIPIEEQENFKKNLALVTSKEKEFSSLKKEMKKNQEVLMDLLENEFKKNPDESQSVSLRGIGTAKFETISNLQVNLSEEEKLSLFEYIYAEGLFDLLEFNEEKLFEYSQEIFNEVGHHISGISETKTYKVSYSAR